MPAPFILLTPEALTDEVTATPSETGESGALASFSGYVRAENALTALELQHHPVLTKQALIRIGQAAIDRFDLNSLKLAHRFGRMEPGERIVFISAGARHRRAALDAVSFAIDVTKTQAPFWKREWVGETSRWIEPTQADHSAAQFWLSAKPGA